MGQPNQAPDTLNISEVVWQTTKNLQTKVIFKHVHFIKPVTSIKIDKYQTNTFSSGNVANSKCPLLIIMKVQLHLRLHAHYCSFLPAEVGKSFLHIKIVTAQTQLCLYSEQQRAFGISNICYSTWLQFCHTRVFVIFSGQTQVQTVLFLNNHCMFVYACDSIHRWDRHRGKPFLM